LVTGNHRDKDKKYMRMALNLAAKGIRFVSPNPMVGAVIVRANKIIASAYHKKFGGVHAETAAIKKAGRKCKGATLYINLEPCVHQGKTPPCVNKVINSGIKKVVISTADPNPLVNGKGIKTLRQKGLEVKIGIMKKEAQKLNEAFIKHITTGCPSITLKGAVSLDGKIASVSGASKWITGKQSRRKVHQMRAEADAILTGINTILKDDPLLTCRIPHEKIKTPVRIVLDSKGKIPLTSKIINTAHKIKTIVAATEAISKNKIKKLKEKHIDIIISKKKAGRIFLPPLMLKLGEMGISNILVEGGAEVFWSFLKYKLADKIIIFRAPVLLGGKRAPSLIGGKGFAQISEAVKLKDIKRYTLGRDDVMEGYMKY
jgi:diaminohydroxyphosphoribosylaminopyrimidine deaminase/5-amino-6-(5-phosphoribosylamino)uracil reductase